MLANVLTTIANEVLIEPDNYCLEDTLQVLALRQTGD